MVGILLVILYNIYMAKKEFQMPLNEHEWHVLSQRLNPDIWVPQKVYEICKAIKQRVIYKYQKPPKSR